MFQFFFFKRMCSEAKVLIEFKLQKKLKIINGEKYSILHLVKTLTSAVFLINFKKFYCS